MGLLPLRQRLKLLVGFLLAEAALVTVATQIPASSIPATPFYGAHLAWSKLFIFMTMIPLGFAFAALVSIRGSLKDFILLLAAALTCFFHCAIRTLHHPTDSLGPSNANLLHPAFPGDSQVHSVLYNFFCCIVPFFIGLHFRLLDDVPFLNKMFYRVTWPPSVDAYGPSQYLALGAIAIVASAIVAFFLYLFHQAGMLLIYLGLLAAVVVGLAATTYLLRRTHYLHLHHFFIFGTLYLFTPFQNVPAAIIQGLLLGASVEGIATWGFGALFLRRHQQVSPSAPAALPPRAPPTPPTQQHHPAGEQEPPLKAPANQEESYSASMPLLSDDS